MVTLCRRLSSVVLGCVVSWGVGCGRESRPAVADAGAADGRPGERVGAADIVKCTPERDHHPPILHSAEYEAPVPVPGPVNTAGGEDSPFILPDGNTLYWWFTPDVRVPPQKQLLDGVTGIWVSRRDGDAWGTPERVWLQEPAKLALDGAVAVQGSEMWFASAREGYTGMNLFIADLVDGEWRNWRYAGDRVKDMGVGEMHLHGDDLYFHSERPGGAGREDIWVSSRQGGTWSEPVNIRAVNTGESDSRPFVSANGRELWFTRTFRGSPAVFRSVREEGAWAEPELIVSQFAAEPTLDDAGDLYFVHHFFEHGTMIEADIYVARRKRGPADPVGPGHSSK